MKMTTALAACALLTTLAGCTGFNELMCAPHCRSETRNSSSLVGFLYPDGKLPPADPVMPELHLPLRVGLAFLPGQGGAGANGLDDTQKERILDRVRERFASRKFVADIIIIPDYYLTTSRGFEGLQGVQRLYNVDLMALVSYDQVTHLDQNSWSLGYLTIVGAYVLRGSSQETATLVDLAVVDPATRSLLLRAGGTDTRHGTATMIDEQRAARSANDESFNAAGEQMIEHFDAALTRFETDVHEGKANVRIARRPSGDAAGRGAGGGFGGGATSATELAALAMLTALSGRWRSKSHTAAG